MSPEEERETRSEDPHGAWSTTLSLAVGASLALGVFIAWLFWSAFLR